MRRMRSCLTRSQLNSGVSRTRGFFMTPADTLGLVAAWFVFGMARIVFTSKLAEHRIDNPFRVH